MSRVDGVGRMFGFLKKKITETIEKISGKAREEEKKQESLQNAVSETQTVAEAQPAQIEPVAATPEKITEAGEIISEKPAEERKITIEQPIETGTKTETEKKVGLLEKIKRGVTEIKLGEDDVADILDDLKIGMLENDVALEVADGICNDLKSKLVGKPIKRGKEDEAVNEAFKSILLEILKQDQTNLEERIEKIKSEKGFVLILFLGFNGSGKTTTLAKIANRLKKAGLSCVFAAGDTWRAASIEQLEIHGNRLGIRTIKQKYGADSAAVIFDAVSYAKANKIDVILADTAGRTHSNINLVEELKKICRVNKPDTKILVLDSLTGNDIYDQSKFFNEAVDVDGIVLSKADVYEKGGAALSAAHTIKKPILFLGVGQGYDDLVEYDYKKMVDNLVGK